MPRLVLSPLDCLFDASGVGFRVHAIDFLPDVLWRLIGVISLLLERYSRKDIIYP
jgi:hypothetical protein